MFTANNTYICIILSCTRQTENKLSLRSFAKYLQSNKPFDIHLFTM